MRLRAGGLFRRLTIFAMLYAARVDKRLMKACGQLFPRKPKQPKLILIKFPKRSIKRLSATSARKWSLLPKIYNLSKLPSCVILLLKLKQNCSQAALY